MYPPLVFSLSFLFTNFLAYYHCLVKPYIKKTHGITGSPAQPFPRRLAPAQGQKQSRQHQTRRFQLFPPSQSLRPTMEGFTELCQAKKDYGKGIVFLPGLFMLDYTVMKRGYVVFIAAMLYLSSPATSSAADILRWVDERGTVVIVPATLNEKAAARFVVDTGASYTMISQATAKELEIDLEKKLPTIPFQTANGIIQAPLVNLSSIDVGGLQVKDLTAAVHDVFPDASISGLLGLNFLSNFRMDIDTQNGVLHLEKK